MKTFSIYLVFVIFGAMGKQEISEAAHGLGDGGKGGSEIIIPEIHSNQAPKTNEMKGIVDKKKGYCDGTTISRIQKGIVDKKKCENSDGLSAETKGKDIETGVINSGETVDIEK